MTLVDTSVWVHHFSTPDTILRGLLDAGDVFMHPFVAGEIALGSLRNRASVLRSLDELPFVTEATDAEVRELIEQHVLGGAGIGYVDAHLLASARITPGTLLWTRDKRLLAAATRMSLAAHPLN